MDRERLLEDQTVLVRGDRIVRIGDRGSVRTRSADRIVQGRGRYLMPGLVDMHVHAWTPAELVQYVAYGVTSVRNMWGSTLQLAWRDRILSGTMLGPTIFTTGPVMDGDPPVWTGAKVVRSAPEARRAVQDQKRKGYDAIKVYDRLSPDAYAAILSAAAEEGLPVVGHVPDAVGLDQVLRLGQDSIEHLSGYLTAISGQDPPARPRGDPSSRRRAMEHLDLGKIPGLARRTARSRSWNCVTLVVNTKLVPLAEASRLLERPEIRFVPPMLLGGWKEYRRNFRVQRATKQDWRLRRRLNQIRAHLTRALRDEGAHLLLGSDAPSPFVVPGISVHEELALLTQAGLTPFEALCAGTRDAAEFLGRSEGFGTVTVGKRADLLLVDQNPLEEVSHAREIAGVMVRGRWLSRGQIRSTLGRLLGSYLLSNAELASMVPRPSSNRTAEGGDYRIRLADLDLASERWALERRSDDRTRLRSVAVWNNAPMLDRYHLTMDLDRSFRIRQARFSSRRSEGSFDVRVKGRSGVRETLVIGPGREREDLRRVLEPDGILLVPCLASYIPLVRRLGAPRVGAREAMPILRFELEPNFDFVRGEIRLSWSRTRDRRGREWLLEFEEDRDNGSIRGTIQFDPARRLPMAIEIEDQTQVTRATLRTSGRSLGRPARGRGSPGGSAKGEDAGPAT
jgi:imidazolonepropionase-like amidohydrolase